MKSSTDAWLHASWANGAIKSLEGDDQLSVSKLDSQIPYAERQL
jgi:hypothetical protein